MTNKLKEKLIKIAKELQTKDDPSHDFEHIRRVLNLTLLLSEKSKADMDVMVPAALFHDIVVHPKNSPKSKKETDESAVVAEKVLNKIKEYPKEKISKVAVCIKECSFSKGLKPSCIESAVLQDADRLEATGVISIMRTFSSGGQMNRPFYPKEDPLCEKDVIKFRSCIDLFYERLLIVKDTMNTKHAKVLAKQRTAFLEKFLKQFERELKESKIL